MTTEKIEAFWENATADDVARVMAWKTVEARFRDLDTRNWSVNSCKLEGWAEGRWVCNEGLGWVNCQVYREPSWWTKRPDPGPGYRLLGKKPDEEPKPGDECFGASGEWGPSYYATIGGNQVSDIWYRRRIEPVEPKFAVGQMVRVVGPKAKPARNWTAAMDEHIEQVYTVISVQNYPGYPSGTAAFYSVKGVVDWAFRQDYLEAVEPDRGIALSVGDVVHHPNGLKSTLTEKGFEVSQ
jgi:hypothetical protein